MVSPVIDPSTGAVLAEGHLWPGSELEWDVIGGPQPLGLAVSGLKNVAYGGAWDPNSFTPADIELADKADDDLMDSNNANLKPFFDRGGKLLMWHGWADQQVTPQTSTIYFSNVLKTVGPSAEDSIALFMLPGVYHCGGGPGPDRFDRMAALEQWVESGRKPTRIVASHLTNGVVDRTRPLCPFGQVARWNGSGSTDDENNFACVAEETDTSFRPWPSAPRQ
jgi:feruloyl esterase